MQIISERFFRRLWVLIFLAPAFAVAQNEYPSTVLFDNVRIFDGTSASLSSPTNVLVRGNKIVQISSDPIRVDRGANTHIIQGEGRTLMPGLIDAHWHAMMATISVQSLLVSDAGYVNLVAGTEARSTLMRGFTSVRDLSGPVFGLKRAIDEDLIEGPRIWPSGAMISQTGGHGDFRMPYEVPAARNAALSRGEALNGGVIADGVAEVRKRVREQLMLGASQIKVAAGGGVSSSYDPIDVAQYSEEEFRAAVDAAENWGVVAGVKSRLFAATCLRL